jgi:hypothetical protein
MLRRAGRPQLDVVDQLIGKKLHRSIRSRSISDAMMAGSILRCSLVVA